MSESLFFGDVDDEIILKDIVDDTDLHEPDCNGFVDNELSENIVNARKENVHEIENDFWRKEFEYRIQQKDAIEQKELDALSKLAKKELEDWYKNNNKEKSERRIEIQKKKPVKYVPVDKNEKTSIDNKVFWDKVCELCDFQNKSQKSMSRMQTIFESLNSNC